LLRWLLRAATLYGALGALVSATCYDFQAVRVYPTLARSTVETILPFHECRIVQSGIVSHLCELDARVGSADGEREFETVHLSVVLEIDIVLAQQQPRLHVEIERRGETARGRRFDDIGFCVAELLLALQRHLRIKLSELDAPMQVRREPDVGQFDAFQFSEPDQRDLLIAVCARKPA